MTDENGHKIYLLRTGFSEDPCTRLNRTACGVDIIHQYDILYAGRQGGRRECLLQVP